MARIVLRELVTRWGFDIDQSQLIKLQQQERQLRSQFVKLGAAATASLAAVLVPAASLQDRLRETLTLTAGTGAAFAEMEEGMRKRAIRLSEQMALSADDIATGFYQVLSTGAKALSPEFDALSVTALKMAKTVGLAPAAAVEKLNGVLKAFKLEMGEANRVADVFFATSQKAATDVPQLVEAFRDVAGPAADMGITLEQTGAVLAGFAEKNVKAQLAGQSFVQILTRLTAPVGEAGEAMDRLRLKVFEADGSFRNIFDILRDMKRGLGGMTQQQRAATLQQIAGARAAKRFSLLLGTNIDQLEQWSKELENSGGVLDEAFRIRMDTATQKTKQFWQTIKNLAAVIGDPLLNPLSKFLDKLRGIIASTREYLQENKGFTEAASKVFGLVTAFVILGSALGVILSTIKIATASMKLLGLATLKTQIAALLLPFALAAAIIALALLIQDITVFFQGGQSEIANMLDKMKDFRAEIGFLVGAAAVLLTAFLVAFAPMLVLLGTIIALPVLIALEWDKLSLFWKQLTKDWRKTFSEFFDFLESDFGLSAENILKTAKNLNRSIGKLIAAQLPEFIQRALGVSPEDIAKFGEGGRPLGGAPGETAQETRQRMRETFQRMATGQRQFVPSPAVDASRRFETINNNNGGNTSSENTIIINVSGDPNPQTVNEMERAAERIFDGKVRGARSAVTFTE